MVSTDGFKVEELAFVKVINELISRSDSKETVKDKYRKNLIDNVHGYVFADIVFSNLKYFEPDDIAKIFDSADSLKILGVEENVLLLVADMRESLINGSKDAIFSLDVASAENLAIALNYTVYIQYLQKFNEVFPFAKKGLERVECSLAKAKKTSYIRSNKGVDNALDLAKEKDNTEVVEALKDLNASLDSMFGNAKAYEEAMKQEKIDEATKQGKYIPIEFKPNNIFPEGFSELIEQLKPYDVFNKNTLETFETKTRKIMDVDISSFPEDIFYRDGYENDEHEIETPVKKIVEMWMKEFAEPTSFNCFTLELFADPAFKVIDRVLFKMPDNCKINGFISEDQDFEIDEKGLFKKYNGTASNIILPEGVVKFTSNKFYNGRRKVSNVTSFTLPSTVKQIDVQSETPFPKLKSLTCVEVSHDNTAFSSVDGVLLSKDGTELIYYPVAKRAEEYKVPTTVTQIRSGAFTRNRYLKKLIIPGNVVDAGENNFCNCKNLETVIIENGVKSIGDNSFTECPMLQEFFVGESVEKLPVTTLINCTETKVVYAFEGSKAMVNAKILASRFKAQLVLCKEGQTYKDVAVEVEKKERKLTVPREPNSTKTATVEIEKNSEAILWEKARKRIDELFDQIESNEEDSYLGFKLLIGGIIGLLFAGYFIGIESCTSGIFGLVVAIVLFIVALVVFIIGVKKIRDIKRLDKINAAMKTEIEILKNPENHKAYFENLEKKSTKNDI